MTLPKKAAAAVALFAVAVIGLGGCASGSRGGNAEQGAATGELLVTTPAAKGEIDHVSWNLPFGELASLDPIKGFNYPENQVVVNLCETLVQMQPDLSVAPNLASEWEQTDETTYVYQIRNDVTFWDGTPMTVDDVVFSINRNLDSAEGSYWATNAANIASVTATGESEVTIKLAKPDAIFTETLGTPIGAVVSQKFRAEAGENFGNPDTGVMCTGPFKYTSGAWKQGQSITLERNDNYWNADRKAKAKEVEISFVVDPTAIGSALSTGEIQGSYDVPLPSLGTLASSSTGQLLAGKGLQNMAIISTGKGVFGDPAVRRALTRATDREAIAETVYEGTATASTSVVPAAAWEPYPDAAKLREQKLPDLSFDIEAAKKELEGATVDTSQPIKIAYPSERSFYADILNEMANGAKELGLTLEPTGVPSAQFGAFFSDPKAREGYDGFVTSNYLNTPSPISYLASVAGTGSDQNYSGFSDPEVDALIAEATAETDPAKRAEITVQAEALVMQEQPWVPIADLSVRLYLNNEITGVPASFVYLYYPWAADLGATK